ncbi:hypothetical protein [Frondihabitans cladoniiphilus]|uniref:Uncharacterized protein n=1 Tax=Frondihabitans cladoniiphilus TaxID=715785 RepID=A0ABP8WEA1_9MICO
MTTDTFPIQHADLMQEPDYDLFPCDNEHCLWAMHVEGDASDVLHHALEYSDDFCMVEVELVDSRWRVWAALEKLDGPEVNSTILRGFIEQVERAEALAASLNKEEGR